MKILLSHLVNGENAWQVNLSSPELELNARQFPNPVLVSLKGHKRFGKLDVKVQASSIVPIQCDRCGEDFSREVLGRCSVHFIQREQPLPDEMPGDDLRSYRLGQDELDITTEIRDALLLGIPIRNLCDESCKGLCSRCGTNLNFETCHCVENGSEKDE